MSEEIIRAIIIILVALSIAVARWIQKNYIGAAKTCTDDTKKKE